MVTTPTKITKEIRNNCAQISSHRPLFLSVTPMENATELRCWSNVLGLIKQKGGRGLTGWIYWASKWGWETQFHVVWESPQGQIIDPTPARNGERTILFLPDPTPLLELEVQIKEGARISEDDYAHFVAIVQMFNE